jgi:hypothetical protein
MSLFSVLFIPHEEFTPQKNVHSSTQWSEKGGLPPLWGLGASGPLAGVRGLVGPQRKNWLVNIYCNFIVNMDHSL